MSSSTSNLNDTQLPANLARLVAIVSERNPTHQNHLDSVLPRITQQEFDRLESYLVFCLDKGLTLEYLADCYLVLVADAVSELLYFTRHGEYRYSTFDEVANLVYFNEEYMSQYMHGLAISLIFWTSHLETHRFFDKVLPRDQKGNYLEIGPGHGTFFMTAMQNSSYENFTGIDISETSIAQTKAILTHFIPDSDQNCTLIAQDFFASDMPKASCDAIVMGEVLEHVEDPKSFLDKIHEFAKDDAFIFITTCVNAPQLDHIYLFRKLDEVAEMLHSANFEIKNQKAIPYEGKTLEECVKQDLPINVAYVLAKQR
jgi:2-polyprenyl-3-methyl-5-hydroxy-6-metoxy-1,4-benzoquinol methylase